jgi:DNA-binding transcriptional LysR family regulator
VSIASLDLNLLVVLDTVLHEKSVVRAARRLHVTSSAVSNSLAKLRVALGDPLVTRQGRGIVPTPRALELAPALARAMLELERLLQQGPFDAASCTRSFTLAMADAGQMAWLPGIASTLSRKMPKAQLRVVGIDSLLSLGDLSSAEIDLHLGMPATGSGIHVDPLYDEETVLVARKGNLSCRGRLTRHRLGLLRHVRVELAPGRGFRDAVASAYARDGVERNVTTTVPSFASAAAVAAATDLVATLPRSVFEVLGKPLHLTEVRGAVPRLAITMAMCWHERTHADPAQLAFRQLVRSAVR